MVFRAASSSWPTTQWLQTFCPSHPPVSGGGRTAIAVSAVTGGGGKPRPFAIALIRMFSALWTGRPSLPPLSSDPCGFANGGKPEAGNR